MSHQLSTRRVNRLQTALLGELAGLSDDGRQLPVRWSLMHMYSSAQVAVLLALKRGVDPEVAAIAAVLHDIVTMATGSTEQHAARAADYIPEVVEQFNREHGPSVGSISAEKCEAVVRAATQHSDKAAVSGDRLVELMKDADSLDQYLHGLAMTNPNAAERASRVLAELGVEPGI